MRTTKNAAILALWAAEDEYENDKAALREKWEGKFDPLYEAALSQPMPPNVRPATVDDIKPGQMFWHHSPASDFTPLNEFWHVVTEALGGMSYRAEDGDEYDIDNNFVEVEE